jgi:NAD-dependent SIR2 family protein deacetylase
VAQVQPAGGFAWQVKANSGHVAVFNVEPSNGTDMADFFFTGGCETELPKVIGINGDIGSR